MGDALAVDQFIGHAHKVAVDVVASQARLHGYRTQDMFEALLLSLNKHRLRRVTIRGDPASRVLQRARLSGHSSGQIATLIEVKNVYDKEARSPLNLLDGLLSYSRTGTPADPWTRQGYFTPSPAVTSTPTMALLTAKFTCDTSFAAAQGSRGLASCTNCQSSGTRDCA